MLYPFISEDSIIETIEPLHLSRIRLRSMMRFWLLPVVWTAFIFILSTDLGSVSTTHGILFRILAFFWPGVWRLSPESQEAVEFWVRKSAHITEYALLSVLLARAFYYGNRFPYRRAAEGAAVLALSQAALDEFHQHFVKSRTSKPGDVGFDSLGILIGLLLFGLWLSKSRPRSVSQDPGVRSAEGLPLRDRGG